MAYTKKQIIYMCKEASEDMRFFYNADVVNYSGETNDGELYTEIVAEWLFNNLKK